MNGMAPLNKRSHFFKQIKNPIKTGFFISSSIESNMVKILPPPKKKDAKQGTILLPKNVASFYLTNNNLCKINPTRNVL